MTRTMLRGAALAVALLLGGCISPRSYVATELPRNPKPTAAELKKGDAVVALDLAFTTNGKPNPRATEHVRKMVAERMAELGVARVAADAADPVRCKLRIAMDNQADTAGAFGKGFKTGLTFGAAGSTVTDSYSFDATVERQGQPAIKKSYRHLITSRIGSGDGPAGLTPVKPAEAFRAILDDLLVALLRDLQAEGVLLPSSAPGNT